MRDPLEPFTPQFDVRERFERRTKASQAVMRGIVAIRLFLLPAIQKRAEGASRI